MVAGGASLHRTRLTVRSRLTSRLTRMPNSLRTWCPGGFFAHARNRRRRGWIGRAMSVKVTPNGTTGKKFPAVNAFLRGALALNTGIYRLLGGRGMGKVGILTTVGVKTGQK